MGKFNKKLFFVFCFLFFISCFYFVINFISDKSLSEINCNSNLFLTDHEHDLNFNSQYTFSIGKNNGWLKIKGEIFQDENIYLINRKLYFIHSRNENAFLLKINEITTAIDDNAPDSLLSHFLPSAYIKEGLKMDVFIYPQTSKGYLITSSDRYGIYCSE